MVTKNCLCMKYMQIPLLEKNTKQVLFPSYRWGVGYMNSGVPTPQPHTDYGTTCAGGVHTGLVHEYNSSSSSRH